MALLKRNFCLGSEWLYYKIYTGVKTADIILTEHLQPIIKQLLQDEIIQKWFFIRYKDTDNHLRIRFLTIENQGVSKIIDSLYPVFNDLIENNVISKIQTDTYSREIERYGESTMLASETLFWYDSAMMLDYLDLKSQFERDELFLMTSFLSIDSLLNAFSVSINDKLILMHHSQKSFKKEFNADKTLKKEFDIHFRGLCPELASFLDESATKEYPELFEIIKIKELACEKIAITIKANLTIPILDFLQSHIHMMINRQYTSNQRMYECLIYDHLHRFYKIKAFEKSM